MNIFHRPRFLLTWACSLVLLAIFPAAAFAQNTFSGRYTAPGLAPGAPVGTDPLSTFEQLNYFSGNLVFNVPLVQSSGRGGAAHVVGLHIEHHWKVTEFLTPPPTVLTIRTPATPLYKPVGYSPGFMETITVLGPPISCGGGTNPNYPSLIKLVFTAPDGTRYELRDLQSDGQKLESNCFTGAASRGIFFATRDGSSATYISDQPVLDQPNPFVTGFLVMRDGTRYRIVNGRVMSIQDRNGNKISFAYDGSSRLISMTDALNRVVTINYDVQDVAPFGLCDHIIYKGFGGVSHTVRVSKTNLGSALRNTQSGDITQPQSYQTLFPELFSGPAIFDQQVVSSAWLPDGRRYQFFYNVYSDLTRVVLPTGGAVEYDWGASHGAETGSGVRGTGVYRRVLRRRLYSNDTTLTSQTVIERPTDNGTFTGENASPVDVKLQNPDGSFVSREKHYFFGSPTFQGLNDLSYDHYPRWKDGREFKTEFLAPGDVVVRRLEHNWQQGVLTWWPYSQDIAPLNNPSVSQTTTTLVDNGLVSKQTFTYDTLNNLIDTFEYGFDVGTPGGLLRRSRTVYANAANPINGLDYTVTAIHLRSLPVLQQVYDGDGTLRAQTAFEYDNYNQTTSDVFHHSLIDRTDISGFDTSKSTSYYSRGNPTKIIRYLLNPNGTIASSIVSHSQYDIAGNVVKTLDPRSTTTNLIETAMDFDDKFGTPDDEAQSNSAPTELGSSLKTYAFATKTTNPLGHISHTQYDYYIGQPVNTETPNGVVSSREFGNGGLDPLDRPSKSVDAVNRPSNKSQAITLYNDTDRIVTTLSDVNSFGDNLIKSEVFSDGLGRATESRTYETSTTFITSKREYDAAGRVKRIYNPHRTTSEATYGWSDSTFDHLSRMTKIENFDLNGTLIGTFTTDYIGNMSMTTDQAGKKIVCQTNSLGQIKEVWEITPADTWTVALSFSGQSLNGYSTKYDYDALNNIVKVMQGTQSPRVFAYDALGRLTSESHPESGTVSYQYDDAGNVAQKIDSRVPAVTTTYNFDALSRPISRSYSDGTPATTYGYDAAGVPNSKGQLTSISSSVSSYSQTDFDGFGRVLSTTQTIDGTPYTMSYSYNLTGEITSQTYPSGRQVISEYGTLGRLAGVKNSSGSFYAGAVSTDAANRIKYSPSGVVSEMKLGNGLWEHRNFNSRLQVTQIGLGTTSSNSTVVQLDYAYGTTNNNGNVQTHTITVPTVAGVPGFTATQTYGYDALNRLSSVQENLGTSWTQNFNYDRFGNRKFIAGTTLPASLNAENNPVISTANNRIDNSVSGQTNITYDNSGNLTQDVNGHDFEYDAENRLIKYDGGASASGGATYSYDPNGQRIKKVVGGPSLITTVFIYNISGQLVAEYSGAAPSGNGTSYLTNDLMGTPRVITGSSQEVKARHDNLPFGERISDGFGGRTTQQRYVPNNLRQKFTSYQRDDETELDFAQARYYATKSGRFTSADPLLASGKVDVPQSWNRFTYVLNNPLRYIDPSGLIWVYRYLDAEHTRVAIKWIDEAKVPKGMAAQGWRALDFGGEKTKDVVLTDGSVARLHPNHGTPQWLRGPQPSNADRAYVNYGLVREVGRRLEPAQRATVMFIVISVAGGYNVTQIAAVTLLNVSAYTLYAVGEMNKGDAERKEAQLVMGTVTQYDDITRGNSTRNIQTNIPKADFIKNLVDSGYKVTQSGNATILDNGINRYAIYDVSKSTGGPSVQGFRGSGETLKIRLKP